MENVVVGYRDRPEGSQSKLNTVRDGIKVIRTIVPLTRDYRLMLFFGTIAIVLMLLAVLFFVPVLTRFRTCQDRVRGDDGKVSSVPQNVLSPRKVDFIVSVDRHLSFPPS